MVPKKETPQAILLLLAAQLIKPAEQIAHERLCLADADFDDFHPAVPRGPEKPRNGSKIDALFAQRRAKSALGSGSKNAADTHREKRIEELN